MLENNWNKRDEKVMDILKDMFDEKQLHIFNKLVLNMDTEDNEKILNNCIDFLNKKYNGDMFKIINYLERTMEIINL